MEVYPPSPNWYSPQVIDWDGETLAYGSRNVIIVFRLSNGSPIEEMPFAMDEEAANPPPEKRPKRTLSNEYAQVRVERIFCGHKGRVNAVSVWGKVVASGSDDKTVRLWDVERNSAIRMHRAHKESVSAVCVAKDKSTILSGDKDGVIALWNVGNLAETQSDTSALEPVILSCFKCKVACLKVDSTIAAAAGENGVILLLNASNGQRIAALEPMNGSVQSLSWCKCSAGTFLSASCGSSVRVWKLSEEKDRNPDDVKGDINEVKSVVNKVSDILLGNDTKRKEKGEFSSQRCWKSASLYNCCNGNSKNKVIMNLAVAMDSGEISLYNLAVATEKKTEKIQPPDEIEEGEVVDKDSDVNDEKEKEEVRYFFKQNKRLPKDHTRPIFGMSIYNNWMITHSLDRMLIMWNLNTRRKIWNIGTLGGYVYTIAESPVEPQLIYFSVGDNTIRSWNRSSERENNYEWKMRWQGLNAQVTAIEPHPLLPGLMGFGLKDGRVGVYDISAGRFTTASATHRDAVFSLSWKTSDDNNPILFSCCGSDGHVFYHVMDQERLAIAKTFELNKHINSPGKHTAISWNPDGRLCALGNRDGSITIIDAAYSVVSEIKPHGKEVRKIVWGSGKFGTLMASCSADGTIYVGNQTEPPSELGLRILRGGHKSGAINSISFEKLSQSDDSPRLVSGGNDGRVLIWDIEAASVIGELLPSHDAPVLTVLWDSSGNFIYSGGESQIVYEHHVSEITSPKAGEEKAIDVELDPEIQTSSPQKEKKKKKKKKKSKEDSPETSAPCDPLLSSLVDEFENDSVSLEDHIQTCELILKKNLHEERPRFSRLLLSNREETLDILINEASDKARAYLLAGDTKKYIELSAKTSLASNERYYTVPMWVLASATMGKDVFDASMGLHAKQAYSGSGDPYSSTLTYVIMRRIPEAVDPLIHSHMFADALALAKARLPLDDPIIKRVLTSWARNLESRKMYIQAAECYLAAQLPEIAIGVLQQLTLSENLEDVLKGKLLSAHISRIIGHKDMKNFTKLAGVFAGSLHKFELSIKEFLSLEETKRCIVVLLFHITMFEFQDKEFALSDFVKVLCANISKYNLPLDDDMIASAENDKTLDEGIVLCVKALLCVSRNENDEAKTIFNKLKEAKSNSAYINDFLNKTHIDF